MLIQLYKNIFFDCAYGGYTMLKNPQNLDFAESEERGRKMKKQTKFVLSKMPYFSVNNL